jgi:hypothetical protein
LRDAGVKFDGTNPAATSCSAIDIAIATKSLSLDLKRKTPSPSGLKGPAL